MLSCVPLGVQAMAMANNTMSSITQIVWPRLGVFRNKKVLQVVGVHDQP
jgi:hypothetical protein